MNKLVEPSSIWKNQMPNITYPPVPSKFGCEVSESIRTALDKLIGIGSNTLSPWEQKFDGSYFDKIRESIEKNAKSYLVTLSELKPYNLTYKQTAKSINEALQDIRNLDVVYGYDLKEVLYNHFKTAVNIALNSHIYGNLQNEILDDPSQLSTLDQNYQQVINTIDNFLTWETIKPLDPEVKKYDNPFDPLLNLHLLGCYSTDFYIDTKGLEFFRANFRNYDSEILTSFDYPLKKNLLYG